MKLLSILFLASLLLGQIGGMSIYPGVVIYVHDILLVALLIEGFIQYTVTGKYTKPRLIKQIIFFIIAATFSLLTNSGKFAVPSLEIGALYLVRWIFYALLYILVLQRYTKTKLWLYGLYMIGVGFGLLGLIQFFLYPDLRNLSYLGWDPHFYRLFGTFLDPNFAGIFLVLTILLGVFIWKGKKLRIWVALGEAVSVVSLLLTYSRSSYLALVVAITTIAILKKKWTFIVVVVAFIAVILFFPKIPGNTLNLLRVGSTFARVGNWQEGLVLIGQAPAFGHGFNTLRYLGPDVGSAISKAAAGLDSSLLFVGATTGIVGLAAYGYLILSLIRVCRTNTVYLASLAALGVHSLFVNSAFYPWVMIWFWIVTGIVEKTIDLPDRRHKPIPYRNKS